MEKKIITVKFVDMSNHFSGEYGADYKEHIIYRLLSNHYNLEDSNNPQFVFGEYNGVEFSKYDCIRVFFSAENYKPDFDLYDYCITHFDDYKYENRCHTTPTLLYLEKTKRSYDLALRKHEFLREDINNKTGFCSFVYSNYNASVEREQFFNLLSEYKKVDSAGGFLNNVGYRTENKLKFESNYKFSIAFDNQQHSFIQEKITDAFGAKTIPIYYGSPSISKKFNKNAFINCHDFKNFLEVVEYVKMIDQNDDLYMKMMKEPICDLRLTSSYYISELEKFLVNIVENGSTQRSKELWPIWLEKERVYGRRKRLRDEKIARFMGKTFKIFRKTKVADLLRKKLLWIK